MTSATDRTETNLDNAVAQTAAEIARTDSKAGLLLTLDGLLVASLSLLGTDIHGPALALAVTGASALVAAVILALLVIRPRFGVKGADDRGSFHYWATASADEITAGMREDRRLLRVQVLSRIALCKMRRLRWSGDASLLAVVALAAAMLTR
jgi:hypothetical protein